MSMKYESGADPSGPQSDDKDDHKLPFNWPRLISLLVAHVIGIIGFYHMAFAKPMTIIWFILMHFVATLAISAGPHRLWSHQSFKARTPYRVLVMIMFCVANHYDIIEWVTDHRIHHKYSDTMHDPYGRKPWGFWWSQVIFWIYQKHPKYLEKKAKLDISDVLADPVVRFEAKYHTLLITVFWGIIPTIVPWWFWSESLQISFCLNVTALIIQLHTTGLVNSVAHMNGRRPYDKDILPVDNSLITYLTKGEGYHNYHHVFPYDYSTSEFGWRENFNLTTAFIDFFEMIGQVYDKKKVPPHVIKERMERTGDKNLKPTRPRSVFVDYALAFIALSHFVWVPVIMRFVFNP